MNRLAERLTKLRQGNGLTQKEVADFLEMVVAAYQKYEYGTREPKVNSLIALAGFYGVSIDFLVGIDDVPNRKK